MLKDKWKSNLYSNENLNRKMKYEEKMEKIKNWRNRVNKDKIKQKRDKKLQKSK